MQTNLKPNSRLAKAGTLFFDYLVIFAGAVLYGISVAMFTSPNNVARADLRVLPQCSTICSRCR